MKDDTMLKIENLSISFTQYGQGLRQVDLKVIHDLNVEVMRGNIVAVVGSSGSGKSLLAQALLGILPTNCSARGNLYFEGKLLTNERIKRLRGREIAYIPQSVTHLDPLGKVGPQVRNDKKGAGIIKKQRELFSYYDLPPKTEGLYPFELSGGMTRRVFLSMAMMENARLIVADEPTPGLHLEAAINALRYFRAFADKGNGVLLITHDIDLALEVADQIAVFYAGTTVEEAPAEDFRSEDTLRHPYTKALWRALPQNGFAPSAGFQPYVKEMPKGCAYGPRCPQFSLQCEGDIPAKTVRGGIVRCFYCE